MIAERTWARKRIDRPVVKEAGVSEVAVDCLDYEV